MKRALSSVAVALFVIIPHENISGQLSDNSKERISFDVDYASFRGAEGTLNLEIYLLVSRAEFDFVEENGKSASKHLIDVQLMRNDSLIARDSWERVDRTDDPGAVLSTQLLPDLTAFNVPPGAYDLVVTYEDRNTDATGVRNLDIVINSFDTDELVISDLEFATTIKQVDKSGIFTKYTRDVIPNAASTYGIEIPILYLYCEIYNFSENDEGESGNYQVEYVITDLNGVEIINPSPKVHEKPGSSSIEMGGLNIISLRSRGYYFRIKVTDLATGTIATRSKKFFVYKPGDVQVVTDSDERLLSGVDGMLEFIYADMTLEELDEEWNMMKILGTKTEKNFFKKSDETGKRKVMLSFWKAREGVISRREFIERVSISIRQWSGLRPGWKTDRGRILITYGKPDEIEREPHSVNSRPYEVWRYFDLEGGVEFVFVDKQGFTDYELVHSNARNELQDYNWTRWIQVSGSRQGANIGR